MHGPPEGVAVYLLPPTTDRVAARGLDLDNVGSEVCQEAGRKGGCHEMPQLEDLHSRKGSNFVRHASPPEVSKLRGSLG